MRIFWSLTIAILVTQAWAEAPSSAPQKILVMDTLEFNSLKHQEGRWRYITQLTDILRKMRFKEGDFDAMNSDRQTVYELIQSKSRWANMSKELERICRTDKIQSQNCQNMVKIRIDTFDFIKKHPEGAVVNVKGR